MSRFTLFRMRGTGGLHPVSALRSSRMLPSIPISIGCNLRKATPIRHFATYKVAIVGSGPSACYSAKYLQSTIQKQNEGDAEIDIIERLPTPFGLVRYGVAPDHPEVKNVQNDFSALFKSESVRFFGNVEVGRDVSVDELRSLYDAVILAYGCESDRKLNIPGADTLSGILSAREFVAWYNGHPDFTHIGEQVARALGPGAEDEVRDASVVVIGQGNVALDCARILAKGSQGLRDTDIASHSLPVIGDGVSSISVVGRRGPVQSAFTIKELRELVKLEKEGHRTSFHVKTEELDQGMTEASKEELDGTHGRAKKRILDLLKKAAADSTSETSDCEKKVHLRFLLSPTKFEPSTNDPSSLGSVVWEKTQLVGKANEQKAVGTHEYETTKASIALVSIGYKGTALPGTEKFYDDQQGTIRNQNGRVDNRSESFGGLYVAGWLKRGPSGIIGTNISDAKDTVATILLDMQTSDRKATTTSEELTTLLEHRNVQFINFVEYKKIESFESLFKRSENQPREKVVSIAELLRIAKS